MSYLSGLVQFLRSECNLETALLLLESKPDAAAPISCDATNAVQFNASLGQPLILRSSHCRQELLACLHSLGALDSPVPRLWLRLTHVSTCYYVADLYEAHLI